MHRRLLHLINEGVFKNVVRGFSLVLRDPEGSHYKNLEVKNFSDNLAGIKIKARAKLDSL